MACFESGAASGGLVVRKAKSGPNPETRETEHSDFDHAAFTASLTLRGPGLPGMRGKLAAER